MRLFEYVQRGSTNPKSAAREVNLSLEEFVDHMISNGPVIPEVERRK